jgi:uncharacterized protein (TIGR00369 family)
MSWATERLDQIKAGTVDAPAVVHTLKLGLLDDWGPGWVRKRWEPHPEVMNGDGSMFGGYIAALADQILAFAAMTVMPDEAYFRTVNLQLQFLRVAWARPLLIEARVTASSRRLITVEAEFRREDDVLIAKASAQQVRLEKENG